MATTPLRVFAVLVIFSISMLHAIPDGFTQGMTCKCKRTTRYRIPLQQIKKLEMFFPNAYCRNTEIIIHTKVEQRVICVDPDTPWVNELIEKNSNRKTRPTAIISASQ